MAGSHFLPEIVSLIVNFDLFYVYIDGIRSFSFSGITRPFEMGEGGLNESVSEEALLRLEKALKMHCLQWHLDIMLC